MWIASSKELIKTPTAIALGNFDGIHRGHQIVLQAILNQPQARQQNHVYTSVVSFNPHPREFFTGNKIKLLTPVAEKAEQLSTLGVEQLVLLPFKRELACLNPQQFIEQVLIERLQTVKISVGQDFRFGYQRQGTATDLKSIASDLGIEVCLNSLHKLKDKNERPVRVSSSLIRQALLDGEIAAANSMLGRSYSLIGKVVMGQQIGRTIGFPTANLQIPPDKFLPRHGVYAVDVLLGRVHSAQSSSQSWLRGVMNIGCRPTVAGKEPTIEVHLLNWSGNLYNQTLTVNLIRFLREEQKFASLEALKEQITQDCQAALKD